MMKPSLCVARGANAYCESDHGAGWAGGRGEGRCGSGDIWWTGEQLNVQGSRVREAWDVETDAAPKARYLSRYVASLRAAECVETMGWFSRRAAGRGQVYLCMSSPICDSPVSVLVPGRPFLLEILDGDGCRDYVLWYHVNQHCERTRETSACFNTLYST